MDNKEKQNGRNNKKPLKYMMTFVKNVNITQKDNFYRKYNNEITYSCGDNSYTAVEGD